MEVRDESCRRSSGTATPDIVEELGVAELQQRVRAGVEAVLSVAGKSSNLKGMSAHSRKQPDRSCTPCQLWRRGLGITRCPRGGEHPSPLRDGHAQERHGGGQGDAEGVTGGSMESLPPLRVTPREVLSSWKRIKRGIHRPQSRDGRRINNSELLSKDRWPHNPRPMISTGRCHIPSRKYD